MKKSSVPRKRKGERKKGRERREEAGAESNDAGERWSGRRKRERERENQQKILVREEEREMHVSHTHTLYIYVHIFIK